MAVAQRVYLDTSQEQVIVQSTQEYGDVLAWNKALFNARNAKSKLWNKNEWVLVARIPLITLDQWSQRGLNYWNPDDWKIIKRMLNSSEWSGLRTAHGVF